MPDSLEFSLPDSLVPPRATTNRLHRRSIVRRQKAAAQVDLEGSPRGACSHSPEGRAIGCERSRRSGTASIGSGRECQRGNRAEPTERFRVGLPTEPRPASRSRARLVPKPVFVDTWRTLCEVGGCRMPAGSQLPRLTALVPPRIIVNTFVLTLCESRLASAACPDPHAAPSYRFESRRPRSRPSGASPAARAWGCPSGC